MASLKDKPFIFLGVNMDEDKAEAQRAVQQDQIEGRDWWGPASQAASKTYMEEYLPAIYLLDQNGVIRYKNVGAPDPGVLEREIKKLLATNLTS